MADINAHILQIEHAKDALNMGKSLIKHAVAVGIENIQALHQNGHTGGDNAKFTAVTEALEEMNGTLENVTGGQIDKTIEKLDDVLRLFD